jgi:hypothetical protein
MKLHSININYLFFDTSWDRWATNQKFKLDSIKRIKSKIINLSSSFIIALFLFSTILLSFSMDRSLLCASLSHGQDRVYIGLEV